MTKRSKIGNTYDLDDAISDVTAIWNEAEQDYEWDRHSRGLSLSCSDFQRYRRETIKILKRLANISTGEES